MSHLNVIKLEKTASSAELGKYLLIMDRYEKEEIEIFVDELFDQVINITDKVASFERPQRGGNAQKPKHINIASNYFAKLDEELNEDMDLLIFDDSDNEEASQSPPARQRRFTISYAQATKRLSFQSESTLQHKETYNKSSAMPTALTQTTGISTLTQGTLENNLKNFRHKTNQSIEQIKFDIASEFKNMEERIALTIHNTLKTPTEINLHQNNSMETNSMHSTA